ncbi:hypothetical protein KHP60_12385 [Microvirga sp. 3-52]|uniref:hypothetical protein n=1 Tax=Microvirga sp. 3-52 TaxID=2792425 RepID=UPI001AD50372|nr:hypothetical protein [Microvirga sp. 3-52]MBO1905774.1 hypothetical protein [Microvirga sp. 3-52]MBS7453129.1 hypothetical protein [Microvirga sp. 3-52]
MRLLVDITAHGWGHLSQSAPIMTTLHEYYPGIELVVRSGLPSALIGQRFPGIIKHHYSDAEFGLVMEGPFNVDRAATLHRYEAIHARLNRSIDDLASVIAEERCDAVFTNIGYIAIAAAERASVPSIACSSLNWSDIFSTYCGHLPGAIPIIEGMDTAYSKASLFIRLVPGMPMDKFMTHSITRPIANVGKNKRALLVEVLGLKNASTIVLCSFGGMLPPAPPPFVYNRDGLIVIGPQAWSEHGVIPVDDLPIPYADVLASVDAVVTKPGYGIVSELGCTATPAIMVSRGDWPEEPYLLHWLARHGRYVSVKDIRMLSATFVKDWLIESSSRPIVVAQNGGEQEIAKQMSQCFFA